jgi:hypothetical protein
MDEVSIPAGEDGPSSALERPASPAEGGLTDAEFSLVSARARDPRLDDKDRADAAMKLLFGTRRKSICYCLTCPTSDSLCW